MRSRAQGSAADESREAGLNTLETELTVVIGRLLDDLVLVAPPLLPVNLRLVQRCVAELLRR